MLADMSNKHELGQSYKGIMNWPPFPSHWMCRVEKNTVLVLWLTQRNTFKMPTICDRVKRLVTCSSNRMIHLYTTHQCVQVHSFWQHQNLSTWWHTTQPSSTDVNNAMFSLAKVMNDSNSAVPSLLSATNIVLPSVPFQWADNWMMSLQFRVAAGSSYAPISTSTQHHLGCLSGI